MSYTVPAGNAADLKFSTGYSVPAGNVANLSFLTAYPASSIGAVTQFGTPAHTYNYTGTATGWQVTQWGETGGFFDQLQDASGWQATGFGAPSNKLTQAASGLTNTQFGTPVVANTTVGWQATLFGPVTHRRTQKVQNGSEAQLASILSDDYSSGSVDNRPVTGEFGSSVSTLDPAYPATLSGGYAVPGATGAILSTLPPISTTETSYRVVVVFRALASPPATFIQDIQISLDDYDLNGDWVKSAYGQITRANTGPVSGQQYGYLSVYDNDVYDVTDEVYIPAMPVWQYAEGDHTFAVEVTPSTLTLSLDGSQFFSLDNTGGLPVPARSFWLAFDGLMVKSWSVTSLVTPSQNSVHILDPLFGTPRGWTHRNAESIGLVTQWAWPWTAYTPTQQTVEVWSWTATKMGWPQFRQPQPPANTITRGAGFEATSFGTPTKLSPFTGQATGTQFGNFPTPSSRRSWSATGTQMTSFGVPSAEMRRSATGFKQTALGTPRVNQGYVATNIYRPTRWGIPKATRPGTKRTYGINAKPRFGVHRGVIRFNYPTTAITSCQFGTPTAFETHRAGVLPPATLFGNPLLVRTPLC